MPFAIQFPPYCAQFYFGIVRRTRRAMYSYELYLIDDQLQRIHP